MSSENSLPNITVYDDAKGNRQSVRALVDLECDLEGSSAQVQLRAWAPTEEEAVQGLRDQLFELSAKIIGEIQRGLEATDKKDPVEVDYKNDPIHS
jgi:hypothetical protein